MSNVLITGSEGQLGSELRYLIEKQLVETGPMTFFYEDRSSLDLTDHQGVEAYIVGHSIRIIINCAAYTAVDKAEEDSEAADAINRDAVKNLAEIALRYNIQLVHISTDYVFDGKNYRPYTEKDPENPQGVYGKTKRAGEEEIVKINPADAIIIRTSWVYSSYGNNFVKTMLRLSKEREELNLISDQVGTPTYARDLAKTILHILKNPKKSQDRVEIYHYSNEGGCTWYDFAKAIFELSHIEYRVNPIDTSAYPTLAKRPHYSLLSKSKIKKDYQITIPYWRDSLKECLRLILTNAVQEEKTFC